MKKATLIILLTLLSFVTQANNSDTNNNVSGTIHMIIFADTKDPQIGESCNLDYNKMGAVGEFIADNSDLNIKTYYRKSAKTKKKELLRILDNLNVGKNDVVFFYYSGHGYRTSNSTSPYPRILTIDNTFSQDDQGVSVEEISNKISKANPRLSVIMVDACNTMLNLKEPEVGFSGEISIRRQLNALFLESTGEVIICGSKAGDGNDQSGNYTGYSWSNSRDGGFFTLNFIKAFGREINSRNKANWNNLLSNAKNFTVNYSKRALRGKPRGNDVQIPIYKYSR